MDGAQAVLKGLAAPPLPSNEASPHSLPGHWVTHHNADTYKEDQLTVRVHLPPAITQISSEQELNLML